MPTLPKKQKRRRWQPAKRKPTGKQEEYSRYAWEKESRRYRTTPHGCICAVTGGDVTPGGRKGVTDHVIRVDDGGAFWDERNYMALTKAMHDRKSSLEGKGVFDALPYVLNENGEKIPTPEAKQMVVKKLSD